VSSAGFSAALARNLIRTSSSEAADQPLQFHTGSQGVSRPLTRYSSTGSVEEIEGSWGEGVGGVDNRIFERAAVSIQRRARGMGARKVVLEQLRQMTLEQEQLHWKREIELPKPQFQRERCICCSVL